MSLRTAVAVAAAAALLAVSGCGKSTKASGSKRTPAGVLPANAPSGTASVSGQPVSVAQNVGTEFGDELKFVGFSTTGRVKRGQPFDLELVWQVLKRPAADYWIAVHIDMVEPGNPYYRANGDHKPPLPTSQWEPGKYVHWTEQVTIPKSDDTVGGAYQVEVYPYSVVPGTAPKQFKTLPVTKEPSGQKPTIDVGW